MDRTNARAAYATAIRALWRMSPNDGAVKDEATARAARVAIRALKRAGF